RTHEAYWEDLGASIFRINMTPAALNLDACNETTTYLGPDIDENIALFNWDTNSKGDPNPYGAIAAAAATRAIDDYTIVGAIWSPPDYMKTGQTCCQVNESCGGHLIQTSDNLTQFGRYVAAYVKGWSNYWGVDLEWVSPQNEPGMGANYSSCVYDTEASGGTAELPPAIQAARDELDANGLTWCELTAPDGPWYVSCWDHVQDFFYYVRDIRDYSLADLGGWSIHMNNWVDARQAWDIIWNGGTDPEHTSRSFTGLKTDGLPYMWMTEVCEEPCDLSGAL
ncbi:MAG: hypothetical protein GTN78_10195, partial [Gemmatimonadales bacterium]|nr:hypothetical protein [Gemmatimonadales bacterium]